VFLASVVLWAVPVSAQESLARVAEAARGALERQEPAVLIGRSPRLLVQLPAADPSAPVDRAQAVALLEGFLRGTEGVETVIRAAQAVTPERGYVELVRRFRVVGTAEIRRQTVLLSYRRLGEGWELVELRVSG
jgi:hypothetical protein